MLRFMLAAMVLPAGMLAQINAGTGAVTATASLGQALPPDEVIYQVVVESDLTTSFAAVSAALKGTDLAGAFTGVYTSQHTSGNNQPSLVLDWLYQLTVPLSGMKDEAAALATVQANLAQAKVPLTLTYSVQGSATSAQALVRSCALADLVAATRTQAQQLAAGANITLGNLTNLASSVSTMIGPAAPMPYIVPSCLLTATFGGTASTLTVAASRNINAAPDQATILEYVYTAAAGTLDDAMAALAGTGTVAANLVSVNALYGQTDLEWVFSVTTPLEKLGDLLAALQKTQQPGSAVTRIDFAVGGTGLSQKLIDSQDCSKTSLVADAQAQARRMAAAADVGLGGIVAVSDGGGQISLGAYLVPVFRTGNFLNSSLTSLLSSPVQACSVTVTFGITQ